MLTGRGRGLCRLILWRRALIFGGGYRHCSRGSCSRHGDGVGEMGERDGVVVLADFGLFLKFEFEWAWGNRESINV